MVAFARVGGGGEKLGALRTWRILSIRTALYAPLDVEQLHALLVRVPMSIPFSVLVIS